jgi:hypothetical protein
MTKEELSKLPRVFKTALFNKAAAKAGISDKELCQAIKEINAGQWDADLGGNVFKKRLNENRHRSIVVSKNGSFWVFSFLFAKADRENISDKELKDFKLVAKLYSGYTEDNIFTQLASKNLVEICNDPKKI